MAKKILIVDDDADIRSLLNDVLRRAGYDTAFAEDAISAISVARRESPDLILLNLGLPAGEGYVVMERLRGIASLGWVPVVVVSARDAAQFRNRALEEGARAFVEKPIDMTELLRVVQRELGES